MVNSDRWTLVGAGTERYLYAHNDEAVIVADGEAHHMGLLQSALAMSRWRDPTDEDRRLAAEAIDATTIPTVDRSDFVPS